MFFLNYIVIGTKKKHKQMLTNIYTAEDRVFTILVRMAEV